MAPDKFPIPYYALETVASCMRRDDDAPLLSCPIAAIQNEDERRYQLALFCTQLLRAARHPSNHFEELDKHLSTLLPQSYTCHPSAVRKTHDSQNIPAIMEAKKTLARFPCHPQRLFHFTLTSSAEPAVNDAMWGSMARARWDARYIIPQGQFLIQRTVDPNDPNWSVKVLQDMTTTIWEYLYVTTYFDTNFLVCLLNMAAPGRGYDLQMARDMFSYVNLLAELINAFDTIHNFWLRGQPEPFDDDTSPEGLALKAALFPENMNKAVETQNHNIIRAFLWIVWQRSVMLHFYGVIGLQLAHGVTPESRSLLAVGGQKRLQELGIDKNLRYEKASSYLCNWALELLRRSRTGLSLDFRRFFQLFDQQFQGRQGRCTEESTQPCRGDKPNSCHRFTGAKIEAQSAHSHLCNGSCDKIFWDESSYRSAMPPRAVCVEQGGSMLRYKAASNKCMAISHVWAHGQGGRPEYGINACLHQRYSGLAKQHGCDSYWIDSACIPSEDQLRKEAIAGINIIFAQSRVVLISDKDLQAIDIRHPTIEVLETVLSVLLVCDWNVRAWTMLEATRANQTVHILGKGDHAVLLLDLLKHVWKEGAVDLAVLLGSAEHLLPSQDHDAPKPIEEAGYVLSQRHASRSGDDVLIWALLNKCSTSGDVLKIWKAAGSVNTAFLMSSAPRIEGHVGWSWAPASPTITPQTRHLTTASKEKFYTVRYHSYDGNGSFVGNITDKGLLGRWFFQNIDGDALTTHYKENYQPWPPEGYEEWDFSEEDQEHSDDSDIAVCCKVIEELHKQGYHVRVLKPAASDGSSPYTGGQDRGDYVGSTAAVCFSDNERQRWTWKGVYQWSDEELLWDWSVGEMLLV